MYPKASRSLLRTACHWRNIVLQKKLSIILQYCEKESLTHLQRSKSGSTVLVGPSSVPTSSQQLFAAASVIDKEWSPHHLFLCAAVAARFVAPNILVGSIIPRVFHHEIAFVRLYAEEFSIFCALFLLKIAECASFSLDDELISQTLSKVLEDSARVMFERLQLVVREAASSTSEVELYLSEYLVRHHQ